jgi:hypothetical protein
MVHSIDIHPSRKHIRVVRQYQKMYADFQWIIELTGASF